MTGLGYEVGSGRQIKFWSDAWCGERPLKLEFLDIFAMAVDSDAVVASYMSVLGGEIVWKPILRRAVFNWEIPRVAQFLDRLQGSRIYMGEEDHRVWVEGPRDQFTVKVAYHHVANVADMPGPWNMLWYNAVLQGAIFPMDCGFE